jgi:hypothetical protein
MSKLIVAKLIVAKLIVAKLIVAKLRIGYERRLADCGWQAHCDRCS